MYNLEAIRVNSDLIAVHVKHASVEIMERLYDVLKNEHVIWTHNTFYMADTFHDRNMAMISKELNQINQEQLADDGLLDLYRQLRGVCDLTRGWLKSPLQLALMIEKSFAEHRDGISYRVAFDVADTIASTDRSMLMQRQLKTSYDVSVHAIADQIISMMPPSLLKRM